MNWRVYLDKNGDVHFKDWSDWAIYDRPRISMLKPLADDPKSNLEEYEPGRYIEYNPEHRNTGA